MIPVTKPFLPPQAQYQKYLDGIWSRNWLTNNGPLVNELELRLKKRLQLKHLLYLTNGTLAIQLAIKALNLTGEIITTPFSYVATTSSIVWENCTPIFVDIDKETLNIDPERIESAITPNTSAILATHVFGNACNVKAIADVSKRYNLKIIYDAAHAFGTLYLGESVFAQGDISTTSFHATKLFHTIEGGAVFTMDPDLLKKMSHLRNFGHDGPERFDGVGINAKNSEFHAAMGLCNLTYIDEIILRRKSQCKIYDDLLTNLDVTRPKVQEGCQCNHAYYPIIYKSEADVLKAQNALVKKEIFPRRYFYPSLSALPYVVGQNTPISDDISSRILCLPLYHELSEVEQNMIARILLRAQNY